MQVKNIRSVFLAVPLRHKIAAAGLAAVIASGFFWWSRHEAMRPAMPAVLSFDGSAAQQASPGVMSTNEPALTLAQSILSDEAIDGLAKQAAVTASSGKSAGAEFRARLEMTQPSVTSLQVNYRDADKKLSVKAANAIAHLLAAWKPPVIVPVRAAPPRTAAVTPAQAHPLQHRQTAPRESDALRALEVQLSKIDKEIAAEAEQEQSITPHAVSEAVGAEAADSEEVQRHLLETQLIAAQKKLVDLRVRYTDEYPDVETAKENIAEIQKELAAAKRPASPQTVDASQNNNVDPLFAKRDELQRAIAAEKGREAKQRKDVVPVVEEPLVAAQTASTAPPTPVLSTAQNPFTLVRPAEGPRPRFYEGNFLLIGALTGMLCGLLYLGGSMWQYQPGGSSVSDVEEVMGYEVVTGDAFSPIAQENFRVSQARQADDEAPVADAEHQVPANMPSAIASDESWAKEIKKAISQTEIGREDEVLAIRDEVLAVREEALVSHGAWLQEQAQYDEVLQAVRDNVKRNPNSWMAHTEAARLALAKGDFNAAIKEITNAIALAPEKARPGLNQIVLQLTRSAQLDM